MSSAYPFPLLSANSAVKPVETLVADTAKPVIKKSREERVKKLATQVFAELVFTAAVNSALMFCFSAPLGTTVIAATLLGGLVIWGGIYSKIHGTERADYQVLYRLLRRVEKITAIALGVLVQSGGPGYFVHELGHATAASLLYIDSKPVIEVTPFVGGETILKGSSHLTRMGARLGATRSLCLFAAAGVISSTCFVMGNIEVAHRLKHRYRWIRQIMSCVAVAQLVSEVLYGLAVFFVKGMSPSHDFVRLWAAGRYTSTDPNIDDHCSTIFTVHHSSAWADDTDDTDGSGN